MKNIDRIKAIVFDVDQTLTQDVSWMYMTRELGASEEEHKRIFKDFQEGLITYPDAKQQLLAIWRSTGNATKSFMGDLFAMLPLKPEATEVIDKLKSNYAICLISGSMDIYIENLAQRFDIKDWYANTRLIFDQENQLIDMDYTLDQATKKWEQFQKYQQKYGYTLADCAIVGNGAGDKLLFEKLGLAVLVDSAENSAELRDIVDVEIKSLRELLEIF